MTPKGQGVITGRRDLLYDPKVHSGLCGQFDLVYDPKGPGDLCGRFDLVPQKVTGSLEVGLTYFMTPKVMVTFVVGLT